jgi:hypothetical protein
MDTDILEEPAASIFRVEITLSQRYQLDSSETLIPFTKLHGITAQSSVIFIVTIARLSYLTSSDLLQFYKVRRSWYPYNTPEKGQRYIKKLWYLT